jgi:vacuolar-type H+-ATPase subunit I/STV1
VDKALGRAAQQFKDLAPPVVDRSTTSAMVRLEERVAELSRQREADEATHKEYLESLGATVARLAAAQAEDLERILDTIEATRPPVQDDGDDRVGKLAESLEAIADLPTTTDELVTVVSEQTAAFNAQMEAVRRRLALRARTALDRPTLEQLADLVAERLGKPD